MNINKKIYVIANWKMQLLNKEAVDLANLLKHENIKALKQNIELILCPSFTALASVAETIKKSDIKLGAQNVFYHEKGQYTGEVSSCQLKELGVEYVIVGHSERRQHLKENDEDVNRKVNLCLDYGLTPIICVGETFEERQMGKTDLVLIRQVSRALEDVGVDKLNKKSIVVAYEPVWVIGTGQAIQAADAEHVAQVIRQALLEFFPQEIIKKKITVIYGGSVDSSNVREFIKPGLLDGVLVGGASLSIDKFSAIIKQLNTKD